MNGIIYCRVSSKEQIQGTSLDSQMLACEEYARAHSITILRRFVEKGESAKFADRTQLLELIDFCRDNGQVQVLLVWKVDRFARNVADHFQVKATLSKYGVRVASVTEPIDANPEGKLMETILAGFAQFDNDIRAMRTVQGMRRKIAEGIYPWKAPLGYKTVNLRGHKKNEPDGPNQPLFRLLQKAWQDFATGAYTKAEIRRLMESYGIVTHSGQPLCPQSIDDLFRNPYYAGIICDPWSGEEFEGRHIPMVSKEDFARVQQVIKGRCNVVPHQRYRREFPLRGLVRCPICRRYLTASFSRGRSERYPYYRCRTKGCERYGKSVRSDGVHAEYENFVAEVAPNESILERLGQWIVDRPEVAMRSSAERRARRRTTIESINRELQELIRMRAQKLLTDGEFIAQRQLIVDKRTALEGKNREPKLNVTEVREQLHGMSRELLTLPATWRDLPDVSRRRFQRLLLPVGYELGKVRTAELGPLFRLSDRFSISNSTVVARDNISWNRVCEDIQELSNILNGPEAPEKGSSSAVRQTSSK